MAIKYNCPAENLIYQAIKNQGRQCLKETIVYANIEKKENVNAVCCLTSFPNLGLFM